MKNYMNSAYALNKVNTSAIVYGFVDGSSFDYTLEDFLAENPGKTPEDFQYWKDWSDSDLKERDRGEYRETYKNVSYHALEETELCAAPSPEDTILDAPDRAAAKQARRFLAKQALDKLTDIQRRRYIAHEANGMTTRKIADREGVSHVAVVYSLEGAEKRIEKIFANNLKTTYQNA